jgi:hypothetical protein
VDATSTQFRVFDRNVTLFRVTSAGVLIPGLTSGRVPIVDTGGLLKDDPGLTVTGTGASLVATFSGLEITGGAPGVGKVLRDSGAGTGIAVWAALPSGGVTNGAGANVIPKSDGANLVASALTEVNPGEITTTTGVALGLGATAPAAGTGVSRVGKGVTITASPAVASTDTAGAAAGGAVTITAGNAARNASGNANGGDVIINFGSYVGTARSSKLSLVSGSYSWGLQMSRTSDSAIVLSNLDLTEAQVGSYNAVFGYGTNPKAYSNLTLFGSGAGGSAIASTGLTAIGSTSGSAGGNEANGISGASQTSGGNSTYLGYGAAASLGVHARAIGIGYTARPTASDMAVIGGKTVSLLQLGSDSFDTQTPRVIRAAGARAGADIDIAGSPLVLSGGLSTGTAAPATVSIATGVVGTTGSAAQTVATRLTVASTAVTSTVPVVATEFTGPVTALKSATTSVNVSSAAAPTIGQVLVATGGTAATWQTPAGGADSRITEGSRYRLAVGTGAIAYPESTSVGIGAGASNTGEYNTAVGSDANGTGTGSRNVLIGVSAKAASGVNDVVIGMSANGAAATQSVFIGAPAGSAWANGSGLVAIGEGAGSYLGATGTNSNCVLVGRQAGNMSGPTPDATTYTLGNGSQNTFVGAYSGLYGATTGNNRTTLGYGAYNSVDNTVVLGNGAVTNVMAGSTGLARVTAGSVQLTTGAAPTCGAAVRGTIWYVAGGTGVADTISICAKSSADAYAWRAMATIP